MSGKMSDYQSDFMFYEDGKFKFRNGKVFCDIEVNDDGYYVAFMKEGAGYVNSYVLREAANLLDALNAGWDETVRSMP